MPQINCPTCKKPHKYNTQSECRPFCSERCKLIDLGAWSQESYRIPVANSGTAEQEEQMLADEHHSTH